MYLILQVLDITVINGSLSSPDAVYLVALLKEKLSQSLTDTYSTELLQMERKWKATIAEIDSSIAYIGSANLTGAGMGMKSSKKRNFEAGILTDDPEMLEAAIEQFDNVWVGKFCKDCGRREYCADPIK